MPFVDVNFINAEVTSDWSLPGLKDDAVWLVCRCSRKFNNMPR